MLPPSDEQLLLSWSAICPQQWAGYHQPRNNFFSHKLIFSFNPESVNITYKIENIEGPACVQRWAILFDFQQATQETSLQKSWPTRWWRWRSPPTFISTTSDLWLAISLWTPWSAGDTSWCWFKLFTTRSTCPLGSSSSQVCTCRRLQTLLSWREDPPLGWDPDCERWKSKALSFVFSFSICNSSERENIGRKS